MVPYLPALHLVFLGEQTSIGMGDIEMAVVWVTVVEGDGGREDGRTDRELVVEGSIRVGSRCRRA
jgi:hypothetical protein